MTVQVHFMVEIINGMGQEQENIGNKAAGLDQGSLFRGIYNLPDGMPSHQRLALRSKHLHELAMELEQGIQNDLPREFLCVYAWAIDAISAEIRLISDRLEIQSKCIKQKV